MKWVTRSHVHIDRVACPWLIRRFIDSEAEFLFVPRGQVEEVARSQNAIPFGVPGVELGQKERLCAFEAIIRKYELTDKPLLRLARIVHAADVREFGSNPVAAGLDAIATGYGLRFPDDQENLEWQFAVYDALYAWCQIQTIRERE